MIYGLHIAKLSKSHQHHRYDRYRLNGVGFRGYTYHQRSVLAIGYSHYLVKFSRYVKVKRQQMLVQRRLNLEMERFKWPDLYRHRGVQNLSKSYQLKQGKKR